ncbi:fungal-specific transcription factor domain-containing protein [Cubamyces menziesii]|nr:fungal-specific transcription factor domain-containing protein [Cubamyces menziesii]
MDQHPAASKQQPSVSSPSSISPPHLIAQRPFVSESGKPPVQRGARACTVCRQAKMKCVGAEDGTQRCQRCQRAGVECVFEKHRRGRKPGSKLSEASKMLRRLEKSLNNAKAKQPSNAQSSSSTAPASQEDGAGPSNFSPSAAQQYDEEMEEEEDDRPEEPIYPEKVIRSSRSSFLDVVMNPVPAAADHDRPHSDSSADRPHSAPKSASQSPSRLQSSPQPRPYIGLFGGNVPKDPVAAGILSESDVEPLFDIFFLRLNPFINLFDPSLHSPAYVRRHSPFLFTAILMACCKFFHSSQYTAVRRLAEDWCVYAFAEGTESVETVQALACMTYWKEPADRRTWSYIGMACRMAVNLRLNKYVGRRQPHESNVAFLERRNRERTYLVLFVHDRSLSMQTGKQWMLHEDEFVRNAGTWHEDGCMGARSEVRPEDVVVAAFVQLRLMGSKATDVFFSRTNTHSSPYSSDASVDHDLHTFNLSLDEWLKTWEAQMRLCSSAGNFHSAFIQFFQSHVRLFLNTFGLNSASLEGRAMPNSEAVRQCYHSASTNLRIISEFAKLHVLQYCQESVTVMTAYAALVLLRLLRGPSVITQLADGATEDIHRIINDAADAYQLAGHLTGSESDCAAYHSRFLRRLVATDMERARQSSDRNGFRPDGIPPLFAQGLPPIRTGQPSAGLQALQHESFSLSRPGPSHTPYAAPLPSLSMAGPSAHHSMASFAGHTNGSMDVSRNGLTHNNNRMLAPYTGPPTQSDESYYQYILGEVREFPRGDGSPTGAAFMANTPMPDFTYPSPTQYRDPSYAHGFGTLSRAGPSSHQYLPPVQGFGHTAYDVSR